MMYRLPLRKPDGRSMILYSSRPIPSGIVATSPEPQGAFAPKSHFRWHPLRGEWVVYASHRQNRTFLPPPDYSPLAVTRSKDFPTEMPPGDYEVAVFENLFPSMSAASDLAPELHVPTLPGKGACEVVVFTQDPSTHLAALSEDRIRLILDVLAERTQELGAREDVQYVLPFENRGVEMGVTLHHPHGQIYAYPFVPPVAERMQSLMRKHWEEYGSGLLQGMIGREIESGERLIVREEGALSFIPVCARYPYETWIVPERPVAYLSDLTEKERRVLARVMKRTLLKHDALWNRSQPYLMLLYQAPTDGKAHPESHLHFQIYPPYRTKDKLKFLAGTELGAGLFVNDSIPEEKASELRGADA